MTISVRFTNPRISSILEQEPGHDRLAGPGIVGQQEPDPGQAQEVVVDALEPVRQGTPTGYREGRDAFIRCQPQTVADSQPEPLRRSTVDVRGDGQDQLLGSQDYLMDLAGLEPLGEELDGLAHRRGQDHLDRFREDGAANHCVRFERYITHGNRSRWVRVENSCSRSAPICPAKTNAGPLALWDTVSHGAPLHAHKSAPGGVTSADTETKTLPMIGGVVGDSEGGRCPGTQTPLGPRKMGRGTCSESFPEPTSGHDGASDAGTAAFRRGHLPLPVGTVVGAKRFLAGATRQPPHCLPARPRIGAARGPVSSPCHPARRGSERRPEQTAASPAAGRTLTDGELRARIRGGLGDHVWPRRTEAGNARLQTTVERPAPPPRCPRRVRCPPLRRLWTGGGWGNADAHA